MERPITTRDGLRPWTQAFGSRRDPAMLQVMGGTEPGIVWPDQLGAPQVVARQARDDRHGRGERMQGPEATTCSAPGRSTPACPTAPVG
ncbi:hypothetical protein [Streptomyces sp. AF1A]|uniref:hypothetical protein n=1 Tax=Streptomyces sp. AF1A TaxID=3394350 RepID=UPI0039BCD250